MTDNVEPQAANEPASSPLFYRVVLLEQIKDLRQQADQLEVLLNELPASVSEEANNALWDLIVNARRYR